MCQICLDTDKEDEPTTTLECAHTFHTSCIIQWFRGPSSACPMCRAEPRMVLGYPDVMARCTMLRRRARAKGASPALKRSVLALIRSEEKANNTNDEYKAFLTQEVRQLLAHYRVLQRRRWQTRRQVLHRKRTLGLGVFPDMTLPLLRHRNYGFSM